MESVYRGAAVYFILLVIVRLSGRRLVAEMTAFDLVLILILAETTQQALLGDDFSLTNFVVLAVTLFGIDIALARLKRAWPAADKLIDGRPTLLIINGKPDAHALRRSRVGLDEIMIAARSQHGLERLDQVKHAVLESDGDLSIIPNA